MSNLEIDGGSTHSPTAEVMPSRRVRLDRDQRRQTLLDAGAKAFAEGGFQATSMEEVASLAGVTRLIVYRHFDSKEALYRAILDRAVRGVASTVEHVPAAAPTVRGTVDGFLQVARNDPDGFRLLIRHSSREPDFANYAEQFREKAVKAAQDLIARRVPDPVLRAWTATTLVALLEEATLAWIETGETDRDEEMKTVLTRSIEAMLRAFPDPRDAGQYR
jgi:AcrR family transcriptional regulator